MARGGPRENIGGLGEGGAMGAGGGERGKSQAGEKKIPRGLGINPNLGGFWG